MKLEKAPFQFAVKLFGGLICINSFDQDHRYHDLHCLNTLVPRISEAISATKTLGQDFDAKRWNKILITEKRKGIKWNETDPRPFRGIVPGDECSKLFCILPMLLKTLIKI